MENVNVNVLSVSEANQYAEVINFIENGLCDEFYFVNFIKNAMDESDCPDLEYEIGNYFFYCLYEEGTMSESAVQAAVDTFKWKMYDEGEDTIISWERKADYSVEIAA